MTAPTTRKCPVCFNNCPKKFDFVERVEDEQRIICKECGAIYFTRRPPVALKYDSTYNSYFLRPGDISKAGLMAAAIGEFCKNTLRNPAILEVGCGNALTLFLLRQQGYAVKGLEPDPAWCLKIVESLNIPMIIGTFEEADIKEKYDMIYSSHTIEHCEDPHVWFNKAFELLNPGGYFWIDTPDSYYHDKQLGRWHHFETRHQFEHVCILSDDAVKHLARKYFFHIVKCERQPEYQSLSVILQKPFAGR
jgi:SAM-dependent methyltransferase